MRIGVISDTNGHTRNTLTAIQLFQSSKIDVVIHCGDIGSVTIPALFESWPTHFVFGNIDHDESALRIAIDAAGHRCHDRMGRLELGEMRIAFLHGDDVGLLDETLASGTCDILCRGHTHQAESRWEKDILVLNPGAVYRARPHSIAVVELPKRVVEFINF
jgi:putative phosphoesterase